MKKDILDLKGNKLEQIELNDSVFGMKPHALVLAQYLRVFMNNQRQGTSSTKTRSEVSGGGKKPWKQKGTGRARVGSTRNPVWRHGGISHGPKPKDWGLDLTKKVKNLALKSVLSQKETDGNLFILNSISVPSSKTKEALKVATDLNLEGKTLFVLNKVNEQFVTGISNVPGVKTVLVKNLNAFDVISNKNVVFEKDAVLSLQGRLNETK